MMYRPRNNRVHALQFDRIKFSEMVSFTEGFAKNLTVEKCLNGVAKFYLGDKIVTEGDYVVRLSFGVFEVVGRKEFEKYYERMK